MPRKPPVAPFLHDDERQLVALAFMALLRERRRLAGPGQAGRLVPRLSTLAARLECLEDFARLRAREGAADSPLPARPPSGPTLRELIKGEA
jgi:hypothetical protein